MGRYSDWSPLGLYADPTPGNHNTVFGAANHYSQVADAIADSKIELEAIFNDENLDSIAMTALRDEALVVADRIGRAQERYEGVAAALSGYAPALHQAQLDADAILLAATDARDRYSYADGRLYHWQTELERATDAGDADAVSYANGRIDYWEAEYAEASGIIQNSVTQLNAVISARDIAAEKAADAIEQVESSGDLNDSFWDNVDQFFDENPWVDQVMTALAVIGGILAIIALFIPGLNLIVIGLAVLAVAVTTLQVLSGNKSPIEGIISIALTILPFGAGKLLGRFVLPALTSRVTSTAVTALIKSANGARLGGVTIPIATSKVTTAASSAFNAVDDNVRTLLELSAIMKLPMESGKLAPSLIAAGTPVAYLLAGIVGLEATGASFDVVAQAASPFDGSKGDWDLRDHDW